METTETITPISSLDEIQALVATPVKIQFKVGDKLCQIEARRLKPFEDEMLTLQTNEVIPPIVRGKTEADDRLDYTNKEFLARKTKIEREVRAQGLFWSVQAFQDKLRVDNARAVDGKYHPEHRRAITDFIQSLLDDDVLNLIWSQIRTVSISVPGHVNFTSPAG